MVLLNTAMLHQICYIRKATGAERQEPIPHVGGGTGSRAWLLPVERAISGMEQGLWCFCVLKEGRFLPVVIATTPSGQRYLKTADDGGQPDHLLALPECSPDHGGPLADEQSEVPH